MSPSSTISPTRLGSAQLGNRSTRSRFIAEGAREPRNAFDALDCIKVAANPVRAHLMGYELWRFAALSKRSSLSLSLSRSIQHVVRILVSAKTIAFLLLLFWRGGYSSLERDTGPLFYPPSKATLKILTGWQGGVAAHLFIANILRDCI